MWPPLKATLYRRLITSQSAHAQRPPRQRLRSNAKGFMHRSPKIDQWWVDSASGAGLAAGNHRATDLGKLEMPIDTRLVTISFPAETVDECS